MKTKLNDIFEDLKVSDQNINYSNVSSNEIDHDKDIKSDEDSTEFFIGDKDEPEKIDKILKAIDKHNGVKSQSSQGKKIEE